MYSTYVLISLYVCLDAHNSEIFNMHVHIDILLLKNEEDLL